jgi:hypothetical protein
MSQVTVRRPLRELDLCNQLRFKPHSFFISSFVKAHWVRFRSGKLASGQASICAPMFVFEGIVRSDMALQERACGSQR